MRSATWRELATNTSGHGRPAEVLAAQAPQQQRQRQAREAPHVLPLEEVLLPGVAHRGVAVADVQRAGGGAHVLGAGVVAGENQVEA